MTAPTFQLTGDPDGQPAIILLGAGGKPALTFTPDGVVIGEGAGDDDTCSLLRAAFQALIHPPGVQPGETVHACPPEGSGIMPCCGRTPFEVSRDDRMTVTAELVTCRECGIADGSDR